jgi:hypothetical protein
MLPVKFSSPRLTPQLVSRDDQHYELTVTVKKPNIGAAGVSDVATTLSSFLGDHPMTQTQFVEPNMYELSGGHIHISYSTSGIDGKPHFTYQDLHHTLNFSGDEIRRVETEIGVLVTVTIRLTIDTGGTSFSILLPRVNIPGEQSVQIQTDGITTLHKFSIIPMVGQRDFYRIVRLTGHATRVFF